MEFKLGAKVHTSDDQQLGTVSHVIIDPEMMVITHLVVHKGILFTKEVVIPVKTIIYAYGDRINLQRTSNELDQIPEFEVGHYEPAEAEGRINESSPALIGFAPIGTVPMLAEPHYVRERTQIIPEYSVALQERARVITSDEHCVGTVDRFITDVAEEYRVSNLVISQGLLLKTWKMAPVHWISNLLDEEVHLVIDSKFFDSLPEYEPLL